MTRHPVEPRYPGSPVLGRRARPCMTVNFVADPSENGDCGGHAESAGGQGDNLLDFYLRKSSRERFSNARVNCTFPQSADGDGKFNQPYRFIIKRSFSSCFSNL